MALLVILIVAALAVLVVGLKLEAMIVKMTLLVVCAALVVGAVFAYRHWDSLRDAATGQTSLTSAR